MGSAILGLDGHDGAGKTTLAKLLAQRLRGQYVRPFGGSWGAELMRAHERSHELTIDTGMAALQAAIAGADPDRIIILDRSWMTVASLVPADVFEQRWSLWLPTILCWSDLPTTLARLDLRNDEASESEQYHRHYLSSYLDCAQRRGCPVLRTEGAAEDNLAALERLAAPLLT